MEDFMKPEEMPGFLNDLAVKYFNDNEDIKDKLVQCSIWLNTLYFTLERRYVRTMKG